MHDSQQRGAGITVVRHLVAAMVGFVLGSSLTSLVWWAAFREPAPSDCTSLAACSAWPAVAQLGAGLLGAAALLARLRARLPRESFSSWRIRGTLAVGVVLPVAMSTLGAIAAITTEHGRPDSFDAAFSILFFFGLLTVPIDLIAALVAWFRTRTAQHEK